MQIRVGVLSFLVFAAACSQQSGSPAVPAQAAGRVNEGSRVSAQPDRAGALQTLHEFHGQNDDGAYPTGELAASPDGTLYGVTIIYDIAGGSAFALTPGGTFTTIHTFQNPTRPVYFPNGLLYKDGSLYGTTAGTSEDNPVATNCKGRIKCGVVFRLDGKGDYHPIYGFRGPPGDGETPDSTLTLVGGNFYGTTRYGGDGSCAGDYQPNGCGTVFEVTPSGQERILHSFHDGLDGAYPSGGALIAVGNALYGTTYSGGPHGFGTVFKVDLTGREQVLYRFKGGSDGASPSAGLLAVNGTFYGTTQLGGTGTGGCPLPDPGQAKGCGTIFSLTGTGHERVLHSFADSPADGAFPLSSLTLYKGRIYGETSQGGATTSCQVETSGPSLQEGCGTIFEVSPSGAVQILYSFTNFTGPVIGANPAGGLVAANGVLYGTTTYGGSGCDVSSSESAYGCGTIFSFAP